MIKQLSIKNFKSIRQLDLSCRRVNVFIGEPNAGKTNVLEAMGLWCPGVWDNFSQATRATAMIDLCYDQLWDDDVEVVIDSARLVVEEGMGGPILEMRKSLDREPRYGLRVDIVLASDAAHVSGDADSFEKAFTRYYIFKPFMEQADPGSGDDFEPPFGQNFGSFLAENSEARKIASSFFSNSRYRLSVERSLKRVVLTKESDGTIIVMPYNSASETLRRMIFFHLAIDTNKDEILVFDEPEAHAYPPYTKILAEKMAMDDRGNQFFLTTHSPYMLTSLISKTPAADLNVVLCRMENFETKAYVMTEEQKMQLMEWDMDAFFNFDRLLPEIE